MPKSADTRAAVNCLAALADPTRLAIFRQLVVAGSDGMPAGAIAKRLGLTLATLSSHLAQLDEAQLVTRVRGGRSVLYGANYAAMRGLITFLTRNCCQGQSTASVPSAKPESIGRVLRDALSHGSGDD